MGPLPLTPLALCYKINQVSLAWVSGATLTCRRHDFERDRRKRSHWCCENNPSTVGAARAASRTTSRPSAAPARRWSAADGGRPVDGRLADRLGLSPPESARTSRHCWTRARSAPAATTPAPARAWPSATSPAPGRPGRGCRTPTTSWPCRPLTTSPKRPGREAVDRLRPPPGRGRRRPVPRPNSPPRPTSPAKADVLANGADRGRVLRVAAQGRRRASSCASTIARSATSPPASRSCARRRWPSSPRRSGTYAQRLATIAHGDAACTTFIPRRQR